MIAALVPVREARGQRATTAVDREPPTLAPKSSGGSGGAQRLVGRSGRRSRFVRLLGSMSVPPWRRSHPTWPSELSQPQSRVRPKKSAWLTSPAWPPVTGRETAVTTPQPR